MLIGLPNVFRTRANVVSDCELCCCPFLEVVAEREDATALGDSLLDLLNCSAKLPNERELLDGGNRAVLTEQSEAELQLDSLSFSTTRTDPSADTTADWTGAKGTSVDEVERPDETCVDDAGSNVNDGFGVDNFDTGLTKTEQGVDKASGLTCLCLDVSVPESIED